MVLSLICLLVLFTRTCRSVEVVFFNDSAAHLVISGAATLNLRSHVAFSFRTCTAMLPAGANVTLVEQRGASGNILGFRLEPSASSESGAAAALQLVMYWTLAPSDGPVTHDSVRLDNTPSLADNTWYTVDSTFDLGTIYLSVERGANTLERILVSDSMLRRFLWDLDVSGGEGIKVGSGFTGCFQGGPGVNYNEEGAVGDVQFGQCPLDNPDAFQECGEYYIFSNVILFFAI